MQYVNRTEKGKLILKAMALLVLAAMLFAGCALAEGSKELIYQSNGDFWNGSRPTLVTNYNNNNGVMCGINTKKNYIFVYAQKGDTICLGSNIYGDKKITVSGPYTKDNYKQEDDIDKQEFTVVKNGTGHINTSAKEKAGANYNQLNSAGYTPLEFKVTKEGIYRILFVAGGSIEPSSRIAANAPLENITNNNYYGACAWDVSVYDDKNNYKTGRIFTDCLVLYTTGSLFTRTIERYLYGYLYYLTRQNYLYRYQINGMNPFGGFILCNSRGVIQKNLSDGSSQSLYHSVYNLTSGSMHNFLGSSSVSEEVPYYVYNPQDNDSSDTGDYTYHGFFNIPDNAARVFLGIGGNDGTTISNPSLKSINYLPSVDLGDFYGKEGEGGYIYLNAANVEHFTLTIPFNSYNSSLSDLSLTGDFSNAATQLTNDDITLLSKKLGITVSDEERSQWIKLFWDGKDGSGYIVPAGIYGTASDKLIGFDGFTAEIHFPSFDVESYIDGPVIERIEIQDSKIVSVDDLVYFNNEYDASLVNNGVDCNILENSGKIDGKAWNMRAKSLDGIHSTQEKVMPFYCNYDYHGGGDNSVLDYWAYVTCNTSAASAIKVANTCDITPSCKCKMTGRNSPAEEFSFSLYQYADETYSSTSRSLIETVRKGESVNGVDAECAFSAITGLVLGSYYYEIALDNPATLPENVRLLGSPSCKLKVVVSDNGGNFTPEYWLDGQKVSKDALDIRFDFHYTISTTFTPAFTTTTKDAEEKEGSFSIQLLSSDASGNPVSLIAAKPSAASMKGIPSKEVFFGTQSIPEEGSYYFLIRLDKDSFPSDHRIVGSESYLLQVNAVHDPATGNLNLSYLANGVPVTDPLCAFTSELYPQVYNVPSTGDFNHPSIWLLLLLLSASAVVFTILSRKKERNR